MTFLVYEPAEDWRLEVENSRPGGPVIPLLVAVCLTVVFGVAATAAIGYLGWVYVIQPNIVGARPSTTEVFELVKIALVITGGIGATVGLVVALRRQRVTEASHKMALTSENREERRVLSERFNSAVKLLGDRESASVRLAGVYALASVADDWPAERQTCIDVLCSYLRLPYDPTTAPEGEKQVRLSVLGSFADHLRGTEGRDWSGRNFDLSGVIFEGGVLDQLDVTGASFILRGAKFLQGGLSIGQSYFHNCRFDLSHLEPLDGRLSIEHSTFWHSSILMPDTTLKHGEVAFLHNEFIGGKVDLRRLKLRGGKISFDSSSFIALESKRGGAGFGRFFLASLGEAEFTAGTLSFHGAFFMHENLDEKRRRWPPVLECYKATLDGATIDFSESTVQAN